MELLDVIILGIVQGITEFLPISSTGHLVLAREWMSVESEYALAFDAVLHFATTAAVILYFRSDIAVLISAVLRKLSRLPVNEKDMVLVYALAIGTVPGVILGLLLESIISNHLQSAIIVAVVLFSASIFFLFAEWKHYMQPKREELTVKKGLMVGVFQALALLPGFSRSGATIAGGMLLGLSRYEATRFSFLLAIPITLGVGSKKMIDLLRDDASAIDWGLIAIGAFVAMVTAFVVIHYFLKFIRKYTLWPFIWYGIILAIMVFYGAYFT